MVGRLLFTRGTPCFAPATQASLCGSAIGTQLLIVLSTRKTNQKGQRGKTSTTVDGQKSLRNPGMNDSPCKYQQTMASHGVSKWCRIPSIHSREQPHVLSKRTSINKPDLCSPEGQTPLFGKLLARMDRLWLGADLLCRLLRGILLLLLPPRDFEHDLKQLTTNASSQELFGETNSHVV